MFRDAVVFVPLAPVGRAEHVVSAIAGALGLRELPGQTPEQTVTNVLRDRQTLLLLDNFEHVLDAGPLIGDLLASSAGLKVLATSRERLHLRGEQEFPLGGLAVPQPGISQNDGLARYPASALFLARARAAQPGLILAEDEVIAVAKICRLLDGLPLAIELAAAQVRYHPPQQLLRHLQDSFDILREGPRDSPVRHQTMRACIAWSFERLEPDEQAALARLSVFAGGCTGEAIESLLPPGRELRRSGMGIVRSLVNKSLLLLTWVGEGEPSIGIPEPVRQYALERLREAGDLEGAFRACAHHWRGLGRRLWEQRFLPDEASLVRSIQAHRDSLRAVLEWSLEHDVTLGVDIAGHMLRFWTFEGRYSEWRSWMEAALSSAPDMAPAVKSRALICAGWLFLHEGDSAAALRSCREGLDLARDVGDQSLMHPGYAGLGLALLASDEPVEAEHLFREAQEVYSRTGSEHLLAPILYGLGLALQVQGHIGQARDSLEESAAILRTHGEAMSNGSVLRALGGVALIQQDYVAAWSRFQEGLRSARAIQHWEGVAGALKGMAAACAGLGHLEQAAQLWGTAEAIDEELRGVATREQVPFARLPQISPHLTRIGQTLAGQKWQEPRAMGRNRPRDRAIEDALAASLRA